MVDILTAGHQLSGETTTTMTTTITVVVVVISTCWCRSDEKEAAKVISVRLVLVNTTQIPITLSGGYPHSWTPAIWGNITNQIIFTNKLLWSPLVICNYGHRRWLGICGLVGGLLCIFLSFSVLFVVCIFLEVWGLLLFLFYFIYILFLVFGGSYFRKEVYLLLLRHKYKLGIYRVHILVLVSTQNIF